MKIVVPYVPSLLSQATRESVESSHFPCHFQQMVNAYSYAHLIKNLAREREDTILVEHDIVPTHEQLNELALCDRLWCAFAYEPFADRDYSQREVVGMGLCKLSADLFTTMPVAFPFVRWDHVDFFFTAIAHQMGWKVHQHYGDVQHLLTRHGGHYP